MKLEYKFDAKLLKLRREDGSIAVKDNATGVAVMKGIPIDRISFVLDTWLPYIAFQKCLNFAENIRGE